MPRLTNRDYLKIRKKLRQRWLHEQSGYADVEPSEQLVLHAYFRPSHDESDEVILAHRKEITSKEPALPHKAGRAWRAFQRAERTRVKVVGEVPASPNRRQRRMHKVKDIHVSAVMRPEPDVHRFARALLAIAREQVAAEALKSDQAPDHGSVARGRLGGRGR